MAYNKEQGRLYIDKTSEKGGISAQQVADCLGYRKRAKNGLPDLGMMFKNANINRWAKFKPVRSSDTQTDSDTWKANDGWCGLSIANAKVSESTDVTGIEGKYTADGNNGWEYLRPRGAAYNELFRGNDFDGYHHYAMPFVSGYTMPFKWSKEDGTFDVSFRLTVEGAANADYLSYKDLPLENYYLGIAFVNDKKVYRLTNDDTIENSGFAIDVNVENIEAGDYTAYPFISSRPMSLLDGGFWSALVYTVPNCAPTPIEIIMESIVIQIQGIYSNVVNASGNYSLDYTITITNKSQMDRKFNTNYIQLRYKGNKFTDPLESAEKQQELNLGKEITVKANSSTTLNGFFTDVIPALQANSIIYVSLNATEYFKEAEPQQNIRPDA